MALILTILGNLERRTYGDVIGEIMVFMLSIWFTVAVAILVGWALKPKWSNLSTQTTSTQSLSVSSLLRSTSFGCRSIFERSKKLKEEEMLAIFKKGLVHPPPELNTPALANSPHKPKLANKILKDFISCHPTNAFSTSFGDAALFAYVPPEKSYSSHQRMFCGLDDVYCIFLGSLNNLYSLIKQYGLSKGTNEAMFVIEAYRTLRDRGPYPADQVLKDFEGSFGFVVYDMKAGTVFVSLGAKEGIKLFWGVAADESVVISDNLETIKTSCAQSFAQFPAGFMFHSEQGLMSFEHPKRKIKAMHRTDSQGVLCGADFKVDEDLQTNTMSRLGSETKLD